MEEGAVGGDAVGLNGDLGRACTCEEADACLAFIVKFNVGIPVECTAIVLMSFLRWVAVVVRVVEIFLIGKTWQDVTTITIGHSPFVVGIFV